MHAAEELQQSVSVAVAYFEDTLDSPPRQLLSCGLGGPEELIRLLGDDSIPVRDLVPMPYTQQSDARRHPGRSGRSARQLMRIQLNLASRPFVELGPLYLRLRILIILLAVIAVPLWLLLGSEKRKAAEAHARLASRGAEYPGNPDAAGGFPVADARAEECGDFVTIAVS